MLRMHDHLKYPYFVAFYENRVKVGLKMYKENNAWRIGLKESFGVRNLSPF
jgi:hypothetical protein